MNSFPFVAMIAATATMAIAVQQTPVRQQVQNQPEPIIVSEQLLPRTVTATGVLIVQGIEKWIVQLQPVDSLARCECANTSVLMRDSKTGAIFAVRRVE